MLTTKVYGLLKRNAKPLGITVLVVLLVVALRFGYIKLEVSAPSFNLKLEARQ